MPSLAVVLLIQAAATLYMVGVIWMVQLVHYPLLAAVGAEALPAYQAQNLRRTSWVVGLPMLLEAGCTLGLLAMDAGTVPAELAWLGAGLLGVVWMSTAVWQVPAHGRLAEGMDLAVVQRLVATNWVRTVAWTARGVVVLAMLHCLLVGPR